MLINLSNHPQNKWSESQIKAAIKKYKTIVDLPFPIISPYANSSQVKSKAKLYLEKVLDLLKSSSDKNNAVHLMGEFTFVIFLYEFLKEKNIPVVVSTTDRIVEEKLDTKIVTFKFVKFREIK